MHAVAAIAMTLLLAACAPAPPVLAEGAGASTPVATPGAPGVVDLRCRVDADCTVKNVGNCCGYFPACVNRDSPTFPEQVKAECAANDLMAVCGFPEIEGCQCIEGRCTEAPARSGEAVR